MYTENHNLTDKTISDEDYKKLLVDMMDSIDSFCKNTGIRYYMLGGTMLGAVRHEGFIPWDDDIDIGMLRSDYDKFCREYKDRNYQVISILNNDKYYLPAAKVIDTRTCLRENINQAIDIGAYIDIFPLDYVEQNSKGGFDYFQKRKIRRNIESLKKICISKNRKLWKNITIIFAHLLCWKSVHSIAVNDEKRAKQMSFDKKTKWIANYHGAWKEKEIMPSEIFDEVEEYKFCGRYYKGVKNYDEYLTRMYGKYMELPPVEKRITHHEYDVRWK